MLMEHDPSPPPVFYPPGFRSRRHAVDSGLPSQGHNGYYLCPTPSQDGPRHPSRGELAPVEWGRPAGSRGPSSRHPSPHDGGRGSRAGSRAPSHHGGGSRAGSHAPSHHSSRHGSRPPSYHPSASRPSSRLPSHHSIRPDSVHPYDSVSNRPGSRASSAYSGSRAGPPRGMRPPGGYDRRGGPPPAMLNGNWGRRNTFMTRTSF